MVDGNAEFPRRYLERVKPRIHKKRDGLLLCCSDGETRFLTLWETILYRLRLTTVKALNDKYTTQNVVPRKIL